MTLNQAIAEGFVSKTGENETISRVISCHKLSLAVMSCQKLSKSVKTCHKLSIDFVNSPNLS